MVTAGSTIAPTVYYSKKDEVAGWRETAWYNRGTGTQMLRLTDGTGMKGNYPLTMYPSNFSRMLYACLPGNLKGKSVLEIGTGGGGLILAIRKFLHADICTGTDCDPLALGVARFNRMENLTPEVSFIKSDMFSRVGDKYDLIVCNPSSMPDALLDPAHVAVHRSGGIDGRRMIKVLARESVNYLAPDGRVIFVVAGIADVERTLFEMAASGLDASVIHAELFRLTDRFTSSIMQRRRFIRETGLSTELIHVSGAEWFEMRYVVLGSPSPTPQGPLPGPVDLESLRRLRFDALRDAKIEMRFAPSDNYSFNKIRAC